MVSAYDLEAQRFIRTRVRPRYANRRYLTYRDWAPLATASVAQLKRLYAAAKRVAYYGAAAAGPILAGKRGRGDAGGVGSPPKRQKISSSDKKSYSKNSISYRPSGKAKGSMPYRRKYKKRMLRRRKRRRRTRRRRGFGNQNPLNQYRSMDSGNIDGGTNAAHYKMWSVGTEADLETFAANCKALVYDGSIKVVTMDLTTTTPTADLEDAQSIQCFGHKKVIRIRNNSNFDCHLQVIYVTPKKEFEKSPLDLICAGLNDKLGQSYTCSGSTLTTNVNHYPEDSMLFKRNCYYKKQFIHLRADGEITLRLKSKFTRYSPIDNDQDANQEYGRASRHIILRAVGGISHDNVTLTQVGTGPFLLDWVYTENANYKMSPYKFNKYVKDGSGALDSMTSAPVQATEAVVGVEEVT